MIPMAEYRRIDKALDKLISLHDCGGDPGKYAARVQTVGWGPPDYVGMTVWCCADCLPIVRGIFGEYGEVVPKTATP